MFKLIFFGVTRLYNLDVAAFEKLQEKPMRESAGRGLVQEPNRFCRRVNPGSGILTGVRTRLVADSRQDGAFAFTGYEKKRVSALVQNNRRDSNALRRLGRHAHRSDPPPGFIQTK